jgi:hypothetical protein
MSSELQISNYLGDKYQIAVNKEIYDMLNRITLLKGQFYMSDVESKEILLYIDATPRRLEVVNKVLNTSDYFKPYHKKTIIYFQKYITNWSKYVLCYDFTPEEIVQLIVSKDSDLTFQQIADVAHKPLYREKIIEVKNLLSHHILENSVKNCMHLFN